MIAASGRTRSGDQIAPGGGSRGLGQCPGMSPERRYAAGGEGAQLAQMSDRRAQRGGLGDYPGEESVRDALLSHVRGQHVTDLLRNLSRVSRAAEYRDLGSWARPSERGHRTLPARESSAISAKSDVAYRPERESSFRECSFHLGNAYRARRWSSAAATGDRADRKGSGEEESGELHRRDATTRSKDRRSPARVPLSLEPRSAKAREPLSQFPGFDVVHSSRFER